MRVDDPNLEGSDVPHEADMDEATRQEYLSALQTALAVSELDANAVSPELKEQAKKKLAGDDSIDLGVLVYQITNYMPQVSAADIKEWTFEKGKRAKGRRFSIAVPDAFKVIEDFEDGLVGTRPFIAVPEDARDDGYVNCDRYIYALMGGDIDVETVANYEENALPELWMNLMRTAQYKTHAGTVDDCVVQGRNCLVQVFTVILPGSSQGFEFYIKPVTPQFNDLVRLVFYQQNQNVIEAGKELAKKIAATVELDRAANFKLVHDLESFESKKISLSTFEAACGRITNMLAAALKEKIDGDIWREYRNNRVTEDTLSQESPRIKAIGFNEFNEVSVGYFERFVDVLEAQKQKGVSDANFSQMCSLVKNFGEQKVYGHLDPDVGDEAAAMNALGIIRIPERYETLCGRLLKLDTQGGDSSQDESSKPKAEEPEKTKPERTSHKFVKPTFAQQVRADFADFSVAIPDGVEYSYDWDPRAKILWAMTEGAEGEATASESLVVQQGVSLPKAFADLSKPQAINFIKSSIQGLPVSALMDPVTQTKDMLLVAYRPDCAGTHIAYGDDFTLQFMLMSHDTLYPGRVGFCADGDADVMIEAAVDWLKTIAVDGVAIDISSFGPQKHDPSFEELEAWRTSPEAAAGMTYPEWEKLHRGGSGKSDAAQGYSKRRVEEPECVEQSKKAKPASSKAASESTKRVTREERNEQLKQEIVAACASRGSVTRAWVCDNIEGIVSTQHATSLLSQLVNAGKFERYKEGGETCYWAKCVEQSKKAMPASSEAAPETTKRVTPQERNEQLKQEIVAACTSRGSVTSVWVYDNIEGVVTVPHAASLLSQLVNAGKLEEDSEGGQTCYRVVKNTTGASSDERPKTKESAKTIESEAVKKTNVPKGEKNKDARARQSGNTSKNEPKGSLTPRERAVKAHKLVVRDWNCNNILGGPNNTEEYRKAKEWAGDSYRARYRYVGKEGDDGNADMNYLVTKRLFDLGGGLIQYTS